MIITGDLAYLFGLMIIGGIILAIAGVIVRFILPYKLLTILAILGFALVAVGIAVPILLTYI